MCPGWVLRKHTLRHSSEFTVFTRSQPQGGKGVTGWRRKKPSCDVARTKPPPGLEYCPLECPALRQNGWVLNTQQLGPRMWSGQEGRDHQQG